MTENPNHVQSLTQSSQASSPPTSDPQQPRRCRGCDVVLTDTNIAGPREGRICRTCKRSYRLPQPTDARCPCGQPSLNPYRSPKCRACWRKYHDGWVAHAIATGSPGYLATLERGNAKWRAREDELRRKADKHGRPWLPADDVILLREDLTDVDAAILVGRTSVAVSLQRRKVRKRLGLPPRRTNTPSTGKGAK